MILFFDTEVFKNDFLVVFFIPQTQEKVIIVNDRQQLIEFYELHKDWVWCAYNGKGYDQYIIKGIILNLNPYDISQHIIKGEYGWKYSRLFNDIPLNIYEVQTTTHSLKQLEAYLGLNIKETQVSFDLDRKLTEEEMQQTIDYCEYDVKSTIEVFLQRKKEFDSHISLLKTFKLPLKYISKTKAQLAAIILGAEKRPHNDEFDYFNRLPDTIRIENPKYQDIYMWYKDNKDYENKLEVAVSGVAHTFAFGGLHSGREQYVDEGIFVNLDVGSYYPALIIEYDYMSRNVRDKQKYRQIRDERLRLKALKDPKQEPYKIVLNSKYGCLKSEFNPLWDPMMANCICVGGQLLLLDLIEKLEGHWMLIQSNTDGLMGKVETMEDVEKIKTICAEWEHRSRMTLEFEVFTKVWQGDVNTYVMQKEDGTFKSKGSYCKKLHPLDYDLPVVVKAVTNYFIKGTRLEDTIFNCHDLMEFQKIEKITSKYKCIYHGEERLNEKCIRIFSSKDKSDGGISKEHKESGTREKVAGSADNIFIDNSDVRGKACPSKLDKNWYFELCKYRLKEKWGLNYV